MTRLGQEVSPFRRGGYSGAGVQQGECGVVVSRKLLKAAAQDIGR
jgi:hypothetical protein